RRRRATTPTRRPTRPHGGPRSEQARRDGACVATLRARYLADKSALARMPVAAVAARLRPLIEDGAIATCALVDLEVLYSARNAADYDAVRADREAFDDVP